MNKEFESTSQIHPDCGGVSTDFTVANNLISKLTTFKDSATQVTSGDLVTSFVSLIDSKQKLIIMTGIHSFKKFYEIIDLHKTFFPEIRMQRLNLKECIIMVFLKLKQGLSFAILSILFSYLTSETCRLLYNTMIPQLAQIFKALVYWPSRQEISSNTPYCFNKFTNVRVLHDCTEVPLQRPTCLTCRIKCYSNYKSTYSLKFLIGISPAGLITYINKPYGGRFSDKAIFEQSDLVELMQAPDGDGDGG